jgi:hypothetical protein
MDQRGAPANSAGTVKSGNVGFQPPERQRQNGGSGDVASTSANPKFVGSITGAVVSP